VPVVIFVSLLLVCVMYVSCQVIQAGKFDQKSTSTERKALLEAILETEQEDTDVCCLYLCVIDTAHPHAHTHVRARTQTHTCMHYAW